MHNRLFCAILMLCCCFAATRRVSAQEGSVRPEVSEEGLPAVTESKPAIYYFEDAQGNLIPVPNIPFEKLEEWYRRQRNLSPPEPPAYLFVGPIALEGQVRATHVELLVRLTIQLREKDTQDEGPAEEAVIPWVRIPLRLNQAIREAEVTHNGEGKLLLTFAGAGDGHVAWLQAERGTQHTLEIRSKIPVSRRGAESGFKLTVPASRSILQLTIPEADLEVVSSGDNASIVNSSSTEESTRLDIDTVGSSVELFWRRNRTGAPALLSSTQMAYQILGQQIECQTRLEVKSYGKAIESVDVVLPDGVQLIPNGDARHRVERLELDGRPVARVSRRDGAAASEYTLSLMTVRQLENSELEDGEIDLSGFEVLGAVHQTGSIDVQIEGEFNVRWTRGAYVRQIAVENLEPVEDRETARFKFFRQPFELGLRIQRRQSTLDLEPTYVLDVSPSEVRLEAILKYTMSGRAREFVEYDFSGWRVETESLASEWIASIEATDPARFRINLAESAQNAGEFEVRIVATRDVAPERASVAVALPKPVETDGSPANVVVISASNVSLTPLPEELRGLIPESLPSELPLPNRQQLPLQYREETTSESSVFAAEMQVREREVTARVRSRCTLAAGQLEVRQRILYSIDYEPLDQILLDVPAGIQTEELQFAAEDTPLAFETVVSDSALPEGASQISIALPEPRLGEWELSITRKEPLPSVSSEESAELELGLLQPTESESLLVATNEMEIDLPSNWNVELQDTGWADLAAVNSTEPANGPRNYETQGSSASINISLTATLPIARTLTALESVWLQTWCSPTVRQDRVVYMLTTNSANIEILLPPDADTETMRLALNGQEQVLNNNGGRLSVVLENGADMRNYTLELWFLTSVQPGSLERVRAVIPEIIGVDRAQQAFWQLVLPVNQHLLWAPPVLTSEYMWQWNTNHWGRVPNRSEQELERLLGASNQGPLPQQSRQYLFSSVGPLEKVEYQIASRFLIVAVVSGVVLVAGLALIFLPFLRHPATLFVACLAVVAVGVTFPEPAVLGTQAALLGFLLVTLARGIRWLIGPIQTRPSSDILTPPTSSPRIDLRPQVPDESDGLPSTLSPNEMAVSVADSES